jgi:hypothetical protein
MQGLVTMVIPLQMLDYPIAARVGRGPAQESGEECDDGIMLTASALIAC